MAFTRYPESRKQSSAWKFRESRLSTKDFLESYVFAPKVFGCPARGQRSRNKTRRYNRLHFPQENQGVSATQIWRSNCLALRHMRIALKLLFLLLVAGVGVTFAASNDPVSDNGSQSYFDQRPRLLLGAEAGSETSLGYKFPSIAVGPGIEIPFAQRFEFQAHAQYSPDAKYITNNGNSLNLDASVIGFATRKFGLTGSVKRSWLWTSQFNERAWYPSAGIVLRNDYWGPGRLWLSYVFPTGCVWATPGHPCTLQSKRLQGVELNQEVRANSHFRWGFRGGVYHFCDQSNPNDPQAGRNCHLGFAALATFRFEFHAGKLSHFARSNSDETDNF